MSGGGEGGGEKDEQGGERDPLYAGSLSKGSQQLWLCHPEARRWEILSGLPHKCTSHKIGVIVHYFLRGADRILNW